MKTINGFLVMALLLLSSVGYSDEEAKNFRFEVEGSLVWQSHNVARIPGVGGTEVSLKSFRTRADFTERFSLAWQVGERHEIKILVAPFQTSGSTTLAAPVSFQGVTFATGAPTEAKYKFHSYRATYRYQFYSDSSWRVRGGQRPRFGMREFI